MAKKIFELVLEYQLPTGEYSEIFEGKVIHFSVLREGFPAEFQHCSMMVILRP